MEAETAVSRLTVFAVLELFYFDLEKLKESKQSFKLISTVFFISRGQVRAHIAIHWPGWHETENILAHRCFNPKIRGLLILN